MREEQRRLDVLGELVQVRVAPGGRDAVVDAGPGAAAVPAEAEAVAVRGLRAHPRVQALVDQSVRGLEEQLVDEDRLPGPRHPSAHSRPPSPSPAEVRVSPARRRRANRAHTRLGACGHPGSRVGTPGRGMPARLPCGPRARESRPHGARRSWPRLRTAHGRGRGAHPHRRPGPRRPSGRVPLRRRLPDRPHARRVPRHRARRGLGARGGARARGRGADRRDRDLAGAPGGPAPPGGRGRDRGRGRGGRRARGDRVAGGRRGARGAHRGGDPGRARGRPRPAGTPARRDAPGRRRHAGHLPARRARVRVDGRLRRPRRRRGRTSPRGRTAPWASTSTTASPS